MGRAIERPTFIVAATPDELKLPAVAHSPFPRIVTGVGGVNVIRALKDLSRDARIINVGYCGSQWYAKGSEVRIRKCRLYHPNCDCLEPEFRLASFSENKALCLTAGDFVTGGDRTTPENSVVDMELAYILALGFREVESVKYVSDNLNYEEYEQTISKQQ